MTLSAGTRLGSYEIVAPLGAGGMGEVYRRPRHRSRPGCGNQGPADRSGLIRIQELFVTPDGKSYGYMAARVLSSDLYLASGLK